MTPREIAIEAYALLTPLAPTGAAQLAERLEGRIEQLVADTTAQLRSDKDALMVSWKDEQAKRIAGAQRLENLLRVARDSHEA